MLMRTQLLCTFTKQDKLNESIDIIVSCNKILYDKVYVFTDVNDPSQLLCTYNVEFNEDFQEPTIDTISLHRKKQSNTLYTINALNEVIRSKNNGILDKKFMVDWDEFQNTLLLTNENGLTKIPTKIHSIIDVNEWLK
jgi:hypothetical protein|tara:strand:+ start:1754 stop:2167 length:414 start_codon:yes stop_codon:yes gene_type:complete